MACRIGRSMVEEADRGYFPLTSLSGPTCGPVRAIVAIDTRLSLFSAGQRCLEGQQSCPSRRCRSVCTNAVQRLLIIGMRQGVSRVTGVAGSSRGRRQRCTEPLLARNCGSERDYLLLLLLLRELKKLVSTSP